MGEYAAIEKEAKLFTELCVHNDAIDPNLFDEFGVKRGLRDKDGNGVLAGITNISRIDAFEMRDGVKTPCDGKLWYRGYNVYDLIRGLRGKRYGFEEVAYLLLLGDLPNEQQLHEFTDCLTQEEFFKQVNEIGISVIGQSGKIAVADKKLYALRDVTATVGCIPLIASSIMSKKLAAGSDAILLDVTMGSGAFMKNLDEAVELARLMVSIGTAHGRKVAALITDMDTPLGHNIGNSLEVAESMAVLQGKGPADLTEVCLQLASNMLYLAGKGEMAACRAMAEQVIADGSAFEICCKMFAAQGGDTSVLRDASLFRKAKYAHDICAPADGYIVQNDVERIGNASVLLGAGRIKKEDSIDFAAGIIMHKKLGDAVKAGEPICTLYADDDTLFAAAEEMYVGGLTIGAEKPEVPPLIYARVTSEGVERF